MKYYEINKKDLQGCDIDLEISLKEYGVALKEHKKTTKNQTKGEFRFYYGIDTTENAIGEQNYIDFDYIDFNVNDLFVNTNWVNWIHIGQYSGQSFQELKEDIMGTMQTLFQYYGSQNIENI